MKRQKKFIVTIELMNKDYKRIGNKRLSDLIVMGLRCMKHQEIKLDVIQVGVKK